MPLHGLRDLAISLGPSMDEATLEHIGVSAARGIHGVSGYFQQLETDGNGPLVQRYRDTFGRWAPPLSTLSESVYEAIQMWATAARRARTTDPELVADQMRVGRFAMPRGMVTLDGGDQVQQRLYLTEARGVSAATWYESGSTG